MKIKRYQANDMRTAIRIVRNELGADAVILSNQRIGDQTEVIAAIDYDESLLNDSKLSNEVESRSGNKDRSEFHDDLKYTRNLQSDVAVSEQDVISKEKIEKELISKIEAKLISKIEEGFNSRLENQSNINAKVTPTINIPDMPAMSDMKKQIKELRSLFITQFSGIAKDKVTKKNPLRTIIFNKLKIFGLSDSLANLFANKTDANKDFEHNWHHALALISHKIKVTNDDILTNGGIVALVGATGVGKTTSIAKLAAQFILRHGKDSVALISTDSYRIAAHEQLKTFSRILNVPMYVATDIEQLKSALKIVKNKKLVLIDTAGLSKHEVTICNQFNSIRNQYPINTYLVYAVNSQRSVLEDVSNSCSNIAIKACILTKLDETSSLGGAISVCIENNIPIAYFSDGQKIPENLHIAFAHSLVSKNVALMIESKNNVTKYKSPTSIQGMVSHANA